MSSRSGIRAVLAIVVTYYLSAGPALAAIAKEPVIEGKPLTLQDLKAFALSIWLTAGWAYSYCVVHFVMPHGLLLIGVMLLVVSAILWLFRSEGSIGSATVESRKISVKGGISFMMAFAGVVLIVADNFGH